MNTPSLEEQVFAFIAERLSVSRERLKLGTTLFGDLGVDGDDADSLLTKFKERFQVDMGGYRTDQHFGSEGYPFWAPLYWSILLFRYLTESRSTPESRARLRPITIQHLIDSARKQTWCLCYD